MDTMLGRVECPVQVSKNEYREQVTKLGHLIGTRLSGKIDYSKVLESMPDEAIVICPICEGRGWLYADTEIGQLREALDSALRRIDLLENEGYD